LVKMGTVFGQDGDSIWSKGQKVVEAEYHFTQCRGLDRQSKDQARTRQL
jgi:hypothetical protein